MFDEQFKLAHPVLSEIAKTYVDLYTYRPHERTRLQLIKRQAIVHKQLELALAAKNN
ncbi:hypothetical protein [Marinobacter zhejiangensis]|uniref:Uncharacterized protein n=1 Tax=Marinobacter zhejiangensis TaxID=488535 RepID=A0A1I4QB30_9GAMM|nr:hypothetical protein [Marinobacter zhejiangensis]SFM36996.1 hypothetical protein SAMN04487963_2274 [Marinobacter zhejiangensis]